MRLNRLEISGFKSFPDRADLHFDDGVTAIVGPNGCGKSNVVDAITWVLGEQSAKSLRGERMEDVIFAGSDARRPTSAAEVKLKLAGVTVRKSDPVRQIEIGDAAPEEPTPEEPLLARDVEVSRRLYRSGESEYLIDGEVCRLRDVQDLLMDSGLGVKHYAVIEQGKIGQILSSRPAERRQLIEEAAGVTKFKSRRRAAELKLEAAQQNLTRIDDIVYELERQRGSLKRQAAKAKRYKKLREELRRWEKVLFARRYAALAQTIEAARTRLAETREREAGVAGRVAEAEARLEQLRLDAVAADSRANALREQAHAAELETGRLQQQLDFDRRQVESLGQQMLDIASELGVLSARRDPVQEEIAERRQALARAEAEREEAARAVAVEERAYAATLQELSAYERAVEQARSEVYSGLNAVTALMHAIERAVEGRERASQELERLDVEQEELRAEIERVAGDKERASAALKKSQEELESTRAALAGQASALASARIEREWRANEIRARERDLAASNARLASLEELDAARAGYGDAARALLASDDAGVRHEGSVADHLEVSSRYERAVEACLGELLQFVVVQDREDALRGLAYARERELGRCGFLVIGAGAQDVDLEAPAPVAGLVPLHEALQIRGPWAAVIRSLVGRAWIAESTDLALAAAARTSDRVVTLAGEVFRGAHLVTGAGKETSRGILAVKREIKELRERQATEHEGLQGLASEVGSLESRVAQVEQALAALDADVHRHEKSILGFELQANRGVEELDRLERRRDLMNSERRRAEEETATLRRREDDAQASILSLQSTQRDLDERLSLSQQQLLGGRDTQSSAANRVADAKAAHAALVERAVGVSQEVRRLVESAHDLESRVAARHDDRQRAADRRTELEALIVAGHAQLDADVQRLAALKSEVSDADNLGSDLHADVLRQEQTTRDARKELDGLRDIVSQSEVARATSEADLSHLSEACRETLQLSLEDVGAEVAALEAAGDLPADGVVLSADVDGEGEDGEPGATPDGAAEGEDAEATMPVEVEAAPRVLSAEEAIAALKGKIDRLGPVNMMAIEQFDELESRHSFLTAQRKDLVDSIAATGDAIKRIEKTTRERFREAFEVINVNFERTFTTLFGGGRAGLILIDESDELESGIDIVAQPPGKRLQNVQLLSGGEKALTAMALMFAMFAYRPSPFCLLDEIDAPLDDANVGRFVEMLQGMQHHTQFILITHHRRTMEIADRLYGVTMEEPGVSKLISLKLN